jgi:hypothetical protein
MDRWQRRSSGVSQTAVAEARDAPGEADLAFDQLYRSSRDDVYAYVASLLHDTLTIAAGVVLIALAVLAPIALIALLVWLATRFRLRRLRERTLG